MNHLLLTAPTYRLEPTLTCDLTVQEKREQSIYD